MAQPLKRRCSSSSSAETVANIEELVTEILVRLPARLLVRFKCVSKHWLSLISDPTFCHRHTLRNPRSPISAFFLEVRFIEYCIVPRDLDHGSNCGNQNLAESPRSDPPICNSLNFVHDLDEIQILQSCNGLLLCRLPGSRIVLYVLNPTTNKYSTLAPPAAAAATSYFDTRLFGYALAFDPSKSPHYKVVCLWFAKKHIRGLLRPCHNIEIYSSETRSWKLLDSSFDTQPQVFYNAAVYCNGAVHWVGQDCEMSYYHIEEERVGFVDKFIPVSERTRVVPRYFRESHGGGRLHLIDIRGQCPAAKVVQVLEMGKDYSGWFFKYTVRIDPLCPAYPHFLHNQFAILSLAPEVNEEDEESSCLLLLHTPGKVISYNLRNNTFKSTDFRDDSLPLYRFNSKSYRYVENYLAVV